MNRAIAETKMNSLTFTNYCCQTILFCPLKQRICNYEILKNTKALLVNQKPYSLLSGSHSFICCFVCNCVSYRGHSPGFFLADSLSYAALSSHRWPSFSTLFVILAIFACSIWKPWKCTIGPPVRPCSCLHP